MANLKDIRMRINSVQSTMQVTSAMKMVSAAKLKKAQTDVGKARPFAAKLMQIVSFLGASVPNIELNYPGFRVSSKGKVLLLVIASDKGLAGAFNANVVKEADRLLKEDLADEAAKNNVELLGLGKQTLKGFKARKVAAPFSEKTGFFDDSSLKGIYALADELSERFANKEFSKIIVVYNKFVNAASQKVCNEVLLPLHVEDGPTEDGVFRDFIIEPSKEEVLEDLIPQAVRIKLMLAIKESLASEHGARMTAMHKATDNATELLGELKLKYNNARQAAITNELIEIVSGASALNG